MDLPTFFTKIMQNAHHLSLIKFQKDKLFILIFSHKTDLDGKNSGFAVYKIMIYRLIIFIY